MNSPYTSSFLRELNLSNPSSKKDSSSWQDLSQEVLTRVFEKEKPGTGWKKKLPLVSWDVDKGNFFHLSIALLCENKPHISSFFYEQAARWLLPHARYQVVHFFSREICCEKAATPLFVSEVELVFSNHEERAQAIENLPMIIREIHLGIRSVAYARRILEMKGITTEEKIVIVQSALAELIEKKPVEFGQDLFVLMHRFFIGFSESFKKSSDSRYLCRLIATSYIFCRQIEKQRERSFYQHHLCFKIFRKQRQTPSGPKSVLGLLIVFHLTSENEIFERKHIEGVLSQYIPHFTALEETFLAFEEKRVDIRYIEWEQRDSLKYFKQLIARKEDLAEDFGLAIEKRACRVFLPRNEEEVFKNSILLARELHSGSDIPQVVIHFDYEEEGYAIFTVIVARVLKGVGLCIEEVIKQLMGHMPKAKIILERKRMMGVIRKKHPKEVSILRVHLEHQTFLRRDYSLDVLEARQEILKALEKFFGNVRDFHGGMFAKQDVAFEEFIFGVVPKLQKRSHFLKKFFHAFFPVESREMIPKKLLVRFLDIFLEFSSQSKEHVLTALQGRDLFFLKRFSQEEDVKELCGKVLEQIRVARAGYVFYFVIEKQSYLGLLLEEEQKTLFVQLKALLEGYHKEVFIES